MVIARTIFVFSAVCYAGTIKDYWHSIASNFLKENLHICITSWSISVIFEWACPLGLDSSKSDKDVSQGILNICDLRFGNFTTRSSLRSKFSPSSSVHIDNFLAAWTFQNKEMKVIIWRFRQTHLSQNYQFPSLNWLLVGNTGNKTRLQLHLGWSCLTWNKCFSTLVFLVLRNLNILLCSFNHLCGLLQVSASLSTTYFHMTIFCGLKIKIYRWVMMTQLQQSKSPRLWSWSQRHKISVYMKIIFTDILCPSNRYIKVPRGCPNCVLCTWTGSMLLWAGSWLWDSCLRIQSIVQN